MFNFKNSLSAAALSPRHGKSASPQAALGALIRTLLPGYGGGSNGDKTAYTGPTEHLLPGGTTVGSTAVGASPLPSSALAPDILVRESFGFADGLRPAGGTGDLRAVPLHTRLGGFWAEYPSSKNTSWITPDGDQTWKFASLGDYLDPSESPSPLQAAEVNHGVIVSEKFAAVTDYPTALLPFTAPTTAYAMSMEGYPTVAVGGYVAIGLTASAVTLSNLSTVGQVWLVLRRPEAIVNGELVYEWRLEGSTGPLLAAGIVADITWNQMALRVDPVAKTVSASINGMLLGTQGFTAVPKYAGFEGVGILDNFVIRLAP